jgi:glycosyltransferase involved in cell wall biosynthesis
MADPLVTAVVPSFNQAEFLEEALQSLVSQDVPVEIFVQDGGSTDRSLQIIERYADRLASWCSGPDSGQAAAINAGVARGSAPFVCWINSDDWLLPGGLRKLMEKLEEHPKAPATFGRVWNYEQKTGRQRPVWTQDFTERNMALRCVVSQPGSLVRRSAWEAVGGLDASRHMAMDYDLWWRLSKMFGPLVKLDEYVAVNRDHEDTKTRRLRRRHYAEAMDIVRRHYGRVPAKWWLYYPYAVWWKSIR